MAVYDGDGIEELVEELLDAEIAAFYEEAIPDEVRLEEVESRIDWLEARREEAVLFDLIEVEEIDAEIEHLQEEHSEISGAYY